MKFLNLLFIPLLAFLVLSCSSDDLEDIIDPKTVPDSNAATTKSIDLSQGLAPQNLLGKSFITLTYQTADTYFDYNPVIVGTTISPDATGTSGTASWSLITSSELFGLPYYTELSTNARDGTFTYSKSNPDISSLNCVSGSNSDSTSYTLVFETSNTGKFVDKTIFYNEDGVGISKSFNGTFTIN